MIENDELLSELPIESHQRRALLEGAAMVMTGHGDGVPASDIREVLAALYDRLYERLESTMDLFERKQPARAREQLRKARAIVGDLWVGLDHAAAPELCSQVASVLDFALRRLSEANRNGDSSPLRDAARALTPLREALSPALAEAHPSEPGTPASIEPTGI